MSEEEILKIVILGEGRVGKNELLSKYFTKYFHEDQKITINPTFFEKKKDYKGKNVKFIFYDTAGQEQFNALNTMYYQNAVGALIVYDVTIFETFEKVKEWVKTLEESVGNDITLVIAGNKYHLADKNMIDKNREKINAFCAQHKCKHFYVSSKTGFNIDETFEYLMSSVLKKVIWNNVANNKKSGFKIKEQPKRKKEKRCS